MEGAECRIRALHQAGDVHAARDGVHALGAQLGMPRSASFTAAHTMSCSISTSSGSTAAGSMVDAADGHVARGRHLHHAAAGRGLERHVLDLVLGLRELACIFWACFIIFFMSMERVSFRWFLRVALDLLTYS